MSSDPKSKDDGISPGNDDFLREQLERISEIFSSPIDGAASVEPLKKKKDWFETPAKPLEDVRQADALSIAKASQPVVEDRDLEKAPLESAEPPAVPAVSSDDVKREDIPAIPETPQPVPDHRVLENGFLESVELPVVPDEPDPPPVPLREDKIEISSFAGECKAIWRHLRYRLFER